MGKINLTKEISEKAPELMKYAEPLIDEVKKQGLESTVARVVLCMDISGSMEKRYGNGTVQGVVDRLVPVSLAFDDDGEIDFWYYGSTCRKMKPVNIGNFREAVPAKWKSLMMSLGYGNNEPNVMKEVIREFKGSSEPVYVMFVTDGGVGNASEIKKLMTEASAYPIFWQFVGIGGSNYGVLEDLDSMEGRFIDNANFFAFDDFTSMDDKKLYSLMLNEFPQWINEAKSKGMLNADGMYEPTFAAPNMTVMQENQENNTGRSKGGLLRTIFGRK